MAEIKYQPDLMDAKANNLNKDISNFHSTGSTAIRSARDGLSAFHSDFADQVELMMDSFAEPRLRSLQDHLLAYKEALSESAKEMRAVDKKR